MGYCNLTNLKKHLPESELIRLTDDAGAGTVDTAVVAEAVEAAEAEVNAWIGSRVKLPISGTVPGIVTEITAVLAICRLFARQSVEDLPGSWKRRLESSQKLLEKFSKGEVTLGIEPPLDSPESYSSGMRTEARTKIFSETELDKF
jgi:phage gp36-like protein